MCRFVHLTVVEHSLLVNIAEETWGGTDATNTRVGCLDILVKMNVVREYSNEKMLGLSTIGELIRTSPSSL